jgi:hypothetical protein
MTPNPTPKEESTGGTSPDMQGSINTQGISPGKKQAVSKVNIKKYKYDVIQLYLDKDREKLLKDCCECCGISPCRVDDHQQDVVWEILAKMDSVLQLRNKAVDLARAIGLKPEDLR